MNENTTSQHKFTQLAIWIGLPLLWGGLGSILILRTHFEGGAFFIAGGITFAIAMAKVYRNNREEFRKPIQRGDRILCLFIAIFSIVLALLIPYLEILSNKVARLLLG